MRLSWSSIQTFQKCPKRYKLKYVDKLVSYSSNEYTIFGSTVHDLLEELCNTNRDLKENEFQDLFIKRIVESASSKFFIEWYNTGKNYLLSDYLEEFYDKHYRKQLISEMIEQGEFLIVKTLEELKNYFGEFQVISTEHEMNEEMSEVKSNSTWKIKSFIDLVIKTNDGKYHIIDYKTTNYDWDTNKRRDPLYTYQLQLYKHFYCKKHDLNPKDVETYFILLKRNEKRKKVEILRMSSGNKKNNNMLSMIDKTVQNIERGFFPPLGNFSDCRWCPFRRSEFCNRG